jgi:hypothetical protein
VRLWGVTLPCWFHQPHRGDVHLPEAGVWVEVGLLDDRGVELSSASYARRRTRVIVLPRGGHALDTVAFPVAEEDWGLVTEVALYSRGGRVPFARRAYQPMVHEDGRTVFLPALVGRGVQVVVMPHVQG